MERRPEKGLETTGLNKSSGQDQGLGAWERGVQRRRRQDKPRGLGGFLHAKADALLCVRYTEWDHNKDAARCPEGGGWGDGDHDPGESVRGSGGGL